MAHNPSPEKIDLTQKEFDELKSRVIDGKLDEQDARLIVKCLEFMRWLQTSLEHAKITIKKLQRLFDIVPKRLRKKKGKNDPKKEEDNAPAPCDAESPNPTDNAESHKNSDENKSRQGKNNGRLPVSAYKAEEVIRVAYKGLSPGDPCPLECGGCLYPLKPSVFLRIIGASMARATRYELEQLRCALCGELFKAELPVPREKYADSFVAALIIQKYFMASPFYRIEQYQAAVGIPLPDSTQWQLISNAYQILLPVFLALEENAAQDQLFLYDDTRVKILSVILDNQANPDKKRTGQYTTVIIAQGKDRTVTLYYSSIQHAGENMRALLEKKRDPDQKIITMTDAINANKLNRDDVIEANCLAHALVKFLDLAPHFTKECEKPIEDLTQIFKIDAKTKGMSDKARLAYHQKHSTPVLTDLYRWLMAQIENKCIEPNSHLGKAITYTLRHWEKLIRFLSVAGAPVSNNESERKIKRAIAIRKVTSFHKTEYGAEVCATFLSLIQTAIDNQVNPVHYLTTLLSQQDQLLREPDNWLPWNYQVALNQIEATVDPPLQQAA